MALHRPLALHLGAGTCLALLAAGCADLNDTGMAFLAHRVPAYAVVNDQLLQGEMTLFTDHTGTVTLRTPEVPTASSGFSWGSSPMPEAAPAAAASAPRMVASCVGRMRYTSSTMGAIDLRCHDGAMAEVRMALIGETRGYGYGQTATGLVSVTFGLKAIEARAHLTVPQGRQLVDRTDGEGLELR